MNLYMIGVIRYSVLPYGYLLSRSSVGFSVASAKAANVSIIRLTHSIYIAFNGDSLKITPPKNAMNIATTFTVN